MSDLVIVQTQDHTGRTILSWYEDTTEAERHRPLAWVGSGQLHIDEEAPHEVRRSATDLFWGELLRDPFQDLSYKVTHTRDGDGYVVPVGRAVA